MENKKTISKSITESTLAKVTVSHVKTLTMEELKEVFVKIDDHEIQLIVEAIQSGNAERIQASIEMPIYRVIQNKVEEGFEA